MPEVTILNDDGARRDAISCHDRSILVEAGAGSGKTAVMAGRVAAMLAEGVPPRSIAAVTFTELAASELLTRVREFVDALAAGDVAAELRVGLPAGLSQAQRDNLANASAAIDEITCSTIHGFCGRLIKSFPVEADIDPGAAVMDSGLADLVFLEIVDAHLRERLSEGQGGILAEMVLHADGATIALMHTIAKKLRRRRELVAPATEPLAGRLDAFCQASAGLSAFLNGAVAIEPETSAIAQLMSQMSAALPSGGPRRRRRASSAFLSLGRIRIFAPRPGRSCPIRGRVSGARRQSWPVARRPKATSSTMRPRSSTSRAALRGRIFSRRRPAMCWPR